MPNRILKESICYSESLRQLDDPASEVLFYRLMVQCDDFGRGDGRPEVVSARCYQLGEHGASPAVIAARLGRLAAVDLVRFYEVDGRRYLYLPRWDKHQSRRAKTSKYPAPPARECNGKQILPPETASKQVLADASRREQMLAHVPVFVFEESRNRGIDSTLSPAAPSAVEPADPMPSAAAIPSTPHQAIVDLYHQHCPSLPRVRELTEARKRTLRLRWKRYPDLGTWRQLFRQAEASPFLSGRNGKWTSCNFDWLISERNLVKVLEGSYDDRATARSPPAGVREETLPERYRRLVREELGEEAEP